MTTDRRLPSPDSQQDEKRAEMEPLRLAEPWVDACDAPPSFPECGGCFRRLNAGEVFGSESHAPYGYCIDCDVFTTWPTTRKGLRPKGWVPDA